MKRRVEREPCYVLHSYPYKETSLIVEVFSRGLGRVALLARGARRPRSAMRGVLLAFHPLRLNWSGTGQLATLTGAEWSGGLPNLSGLALMCGFYLNELILRLLASEDPHEALYDAYAASLAQLAGPDNSPAVVLRRFEHRLLGELGYAPSFECEAASGVPIDPARRYVFEPERGPIAADGPAQSAWAVSGKTLLDLAREDYAQPDTCEEARRLMRALIAHRLGGQVLRTRAVLRELQEL